MARYVENRWKNKMAHARELFYGRLVTSLLDAGLPVCRSGYFELPSGELVRDRLRMYDKHHKHHCITDFLCGIRKKYESQPMSANNFPVPPRYNNVHGPISTLEWMVRHFNDQHPKVIDGMSLPSLYYSPRHPDHMIELPILREVEQLGFENNWLGENAANLSQKL